ncbi:MAG TPA: hypothetical protein VGL08_10570 [Paraburkholderia sp.]
MTKLAFEQIEDVNVDRPYLFVFLLEDGETYWVGQFSQFLQITIEGNDKLAFTFYPTPTPFSLNEENWKQILQTAQKFLEETLARGDEP